ncbi:thioredoxin [Ectobacillus ponti]|uniref:Thioredoxin n=1 Tax=Ectobacillus ponti TaxID=2961894 RepID=A0AA41X5V3_9BACI|nr:thioredoxin [Ectobacillus ponti]MCP8969494.1 thioredoxin [Ectobacillus ponti]
MAIRNATDATFADSVAKGLVLVDFWAPWCGPCRMVAPVLEELDQELGGRLAIVKVNVDENQVTAAQFGIMSIPTMVLFQDGKPLGQIVGFQPKDAMLEILEPYMQ